MCKLSTTDVVFIDTRLRLGDTRKSLAEQFNVCRQTIDNIATRKRRSHETSIRSNPTAVFKE